MAYTVRIARCDSVTEVVYDHVLYAWWQHDAQLLVLERGERGKDRSYIYYPVSRIDHVHIAEGSG